MVFKNQDLNTGCVIATGVWLPLGSLVDRARKYIHAYSHTHLYLHVFLYLTYLSAVTSIFSMTLGGSF